MFRLIFIILLFSVTSNILMANCSDDILGARYKITVSDIDGKYKNTSYLTLWRNGNQIAHEHKEKGVIEVWEQLRSGQLRLTKYFDKYKQGIEYEPNEIRIKHNADSWQLKKQLVTQSLIDDMTLVETSKSGCAMRQQYVGNEHTGTINLQWLANQKLVNKLVIKSIKGIVSWELESVINDAKQVSTLFHSHATYKMTDYSDVGDNESDPFLSKMINMGFVSNGSSEMYKQNGEMIEGEHKH